MPRAVAAVLKVQLSRFGLTRIGSKRSGVPLESVLVIHYVQDDLAGARALAINDLQEFLGLDEVFISLE